MLGRLIEILEKPGPEGAAGRVLEKRFARELKGYFSKVGQGILKLQLENLADGGPTTGGLLRHQVAARVSNVLRVNRSLLREVLKTNLEKAHRAGQKQEIAQEADGDPGLDKLGQTGQAAADYADGKVDSLITGLEDTTIEDIAEAIAEGIEGRLGVPATADLIQEVVDGMTTARAETIAATEMADAFGEAMLGKISDQGFEWKRLVVSDDACEICLENADADPLPIDEDYPSGDDRPPFHPNCRCAVVASRGPDVDTD